MTIFKKGDLVKHYKGTNLIEKEIYEIITVNPDYTGTKQFSREAVVIYEPLFAKRKTCIIEYDDFVKVLTPEERAMSDGQIHNVELLSEEEKIMINSPSFIQQKYAYLEEKEKQNNNGRHL